MAAKLSQTDIEILVERAEYYRSIGCVALAIDVEKEIEVWRKTEDQVKYMVQRFLGWQLPKSFNPDDGIKYTPSDYRRATGTMPTGTNLLDATQADEMVRYMIEGMLKS